MFHSKFQFKYLLIPVILILFLPSLLTLQTSQPMKSVFANSQPIFHPGYGTATIDGLIESTEWAAADSLSLPMFPSSSGLTGTFYVMQTAADLYFGFVIDDDEFTQDSVGSYGIYGDLIQFYFDDNNSGTHDIGENKLNIYSYEPWFLDAYFYNESGSAAEDINDGGIANGSGYSTRTGEFNHFEASFPLCSGDTGHDFCLEPGDIIGFRIRYIDAFYDPAFAYTVVSYPGTVDHYSLALIEIEDYTTYLFLPLILK